MKNKLPEKKLNLEKVLFLLISIFILSLTVISLIFGQIKTPDGMEFLGRRVVNPQDTYPAISLIEQAREGKIIFQNVYSTDNNFIFSPIYLILGWLGHILPVSGIILFHLGRLILGFILLWLIYRLLKLFFEKYHHRILAFLIITLSGGLGFFTYKSISNSYDLFLPTANLFLSLFDSPHLIFEEILLVLSLFSTLQIINHKKFLLKEAVISIFSFVLLLIILLYNLPQYTIVVSVLPILISLAFQLVLIFFGWKVVSAQTSLVKTAAFCLVLLFLPSPFQRLSFFALFMASSILAASGFLYIYGRFIYSLTKKNKIAKFISYLLIAVFLFGLLPVTNYFHIYWDMQSYAKDKKDNYISYLLKDEFQAINWLKNNTLKDTVILAKPFYGNVIGGITGRKIYLGNEYYTANLNTKLEDLDNFLTSWDDSKRSEYLKQNHIVYLFFGKDDGMASENFKPEKAEFLKQVFSQGGVVVYQYTEEEKQLPQPKKPETTKPPSQKTQPRK